MKASMMKKLFTILMVLVFCGTANAVVVSLDGEGTTIITAPGLVTINVLVTPEPVGNPGLLGLDVVITVTGGDVITDAGCYQGDPSMPPFEPIVDPPGLGTPSVEIGGVHFTIANSGVVGYVTVDYTGGTQVVSIARAMVFGGPIEIDGFTVPSFSSGVVTIIPEPATIALLGLGGLALLRRRK